MSRGPASQYFFKKYHYPGEVQQYVSLNFSELVFSINVFMGAFEN